MADETQALDVCGAVQPEVAVAACGLWQQPFLLVVADGHDLASCPLRKLSNLDFHNSSTHLSLDSIVTIGILMSNIDDPFDGTYP